MNVTMPNRAVTDRFGSLSHLDEAPKATFPPVLLRQRGAVGVMRIDRACSISMRRERIEFFQIPSRMAMRRQSVWNSENAWLTSQSAANWSHPVTPCFPLLCSEKWANFPSCRTTSGQHFFKFCRLFRWLWCFPFAARTAIICPENRDIF
jgi:hypothetical protein